MEIDAARWRLLCRAFPYPWIRTSWCGALDIPLMAQKLRLGPRCYEAAQEIRALEAGRVHGCTSAILASALAEGAAVFDRLIDLF